MSGIDLDADPTDPENGMGIIPRAVATVFSRAKELREERAGAWNFSLKSSFIEIYNEDLLDLLADEHSANGRREVQIREDKHGNIIWDGLREVNVKNTSEVMRCALFLPSPLVSSTFPVAPILLSHMILITLFPACSVKALPFAGQTKQI